MCGDRCCSRCHQSGGRRQKAWARNISASFVQRLVEDLRYNKAGSHDEQSPDSVHFLDSLCPTRTTRGGRIFQVRSTRIRDQTVDTEPDIMETEEAC